MRIVYIGQVLVGIGFLIAASASVLDKELVNWMWYAMGLVMGCVGIFLAQKGIRSLARAEDALANNIRAITESLELLAQRSQQLDREKEQIFVYDVHARVDELFPEPLDIFVEARETIAHTHGMQAYADLMNHFAAGERSINRVWSASVDGYIDEVHSYITKAALHFRDARDAFTRLQQNA